jgi:hypothetical protein
MTFEVFVGVRFNMFDYFPFSLQGDKMNRAPPAVKIILPEKGKKGLK